MQQLDEVRCALPKNVKELNQRKPLRKNMIVYDWSCEYEITLKQLLGKLITRCLVQELDYLLLDRSTKITETTANAEIMLRV